VITSSATECSSAPLDPCTSVDARHERVRARMFCSRLIAGLLDRWDADDVSRAHTTLAR